MHDPAVAWAAAAYMAQIACVTLLAGLVLRVVPVPLVLLFKSHGCASCGRPKSLW